MQGRNWFFGTLILILIVDLYDTFVKGFDYGLRAAYWLQFGVLLSAYIAAIVSERRTVQIMAAVAAVAAQFIFIFEEMGVLGSW